MTEFDRRAALKALAAASAGVAAGCIPTYRAERLGPATPPQVLGPFYPRGGTLASCYPERVLPNDLATVEGQAPADGLRLYLYGVVTDAGAAVDKARIEIWQTCHRGRYAHPDDAYGREILRDQGFAYYGDFVTGPDGRFLFRTVMPRRYPAGFPGKPEWWRPPHIHFRVTVGDERRVTTQAYFRDPADVDNVWAHVETQRHDRLLEGLPEDRRSELICPLVLASASDSLPSWRADLLTGAPTAGDDAWGGARAGRFDLEVDRPGPGQELAPEVPAGHPRSDGSERC